MVEASRVFERRERGDGVCGEDSGIGGGGVDAGKRMRWADGEAEAGESGFSTETPVEFGESGDATM